MSTKKRPFSPVDEFIKTFNEMSARYSRNELWYNYIDMHAIALANTCDSRCRDAREVPYVVEGYRLWDKVLYKGQECFVSGRRTSGSFTLKKLDGTRISKGVTFKKLRLLEPATNYLIERM